MHKKIAAILAILSGVMWGSGGVFIKTLDAFGMDDWTIISSRAVVGVAFLFLGMFVVDRKLLKVKLKDLWLFVGAGIIGMMGLNLCYNKALSMVSMSLAAVLLSMSPIFVLLLGRVLFKESLTKKKILCMALAFAGCVLTSGMLEGASGMNWTYFGIFLGILSAFFYAWYSIFSKFAAEKNYSGITMTFYSLLVLLIVTAPISDWGIFADFMKAAPVKHTIFMFLQSVVTSVFPYILYTFALKYLEAGMVSILSAGAEPSAATVFGMLFFAEIPTVLSVIGLIVTIVALTLLCAPEKKKAHT